jgi:peptidoglycan/xylan/chitin deacetylase (PgdA/CDA1 family)
MSAALYSIARQVRRQVLGVSRAVGLQSVLARSSWRRSRLLILCYHGISIRDEHEWDPELFVTPSFLRQRLAKLKAGGYNVLPLADAVRRLQSSALPAKSVVLTFDDGFYNFRLAADILAEFSFPATVYLSTYYCVNQRPILGLAMSYMLWRARRSPLPSDLLRRAPESAAGLESSGPRGAIFRSLMNEVQELEQDRSEQMNWMKRLADKLSIDWQDVAKSRMFGLLNPEEVMALGGRGIDFQLHTHRHRTPRSKAEFTRELVENRNVIQKLTGRRADHFCYPSGDHDPVFFPWLKELGVRTATTCDAGLASREVDSLRLPRFVDTMQQPEIMFESWLTGAAQLARSVVT